MQCSVRPTYKTTINTDYDMTANDNEGPPKMHDRKMKDRTAEVENARSPGERTDHLHNKAIVDSRLRPQSCCHLAKCIEMQEIVDCKLDANNE